MRVALSKTNTIIDYICVLKPRETSLLVVIGMCSAFIAAGGVISDAELYLSLIHI